MCHKKEPADVYEQRGRSIKLVNGSHTISMIDKFPSQSRLWNTASMTRKKVISVRNCDWWRKVDLFWKPEMEKIMAVPSKASPSTPRPNRFGRKIMLCVWWNQSSIVYRKPTIILWPGGIWLAPLPINGIRTCRETLQQFWRSVKMTQRMFCRKTKTVFLARNS